MTLEINKNITKIARIGYLVVFDLCIDWVARKLYFTGVDILSDVGDEHIIKFDLTLWKEGIIKFDKILSINGHSIYDVPTSAFKILLSIGYVYYRSFQKVIILKIS